MAAQHFTICLEFGSLMHPAWIEVRVPVKKKHRNSNPLMAIRREHISIG
jgi:hypothetical protein